MLFKRYLFLAACVLLFIFAFIAYFTVARAQMEGRFREEREKFNVEGVILTATNGPSSEPAPAPVASAQTPSAPMAPDASYSASPASDSTATASTNSSTDTPAPALNPAATDPNVIIGPVPPPPATPSTDGSTNSPAPSDSSAPPMPPPSTMNDSRDSLAPFLVRAAYHPSSGVMFQTIGVEATKVAPAPTSVIAGPATNSGMPVTVINAEATNSVTPLPATNTAPSAVSPTAPGNGRAAGVEASVIVLLYHQFAAPGAPIPAKFQWTMHVDVFAAEMKYIHDNGYHVIPMSDLEKFLRHEIGLPPNSVVISIDDGYKSAVVYAAPILKQYGYPWTFFIYPEFVTVAEGKGAVSWNDLLALQADGVDIESHSMTHPQLPKHTQKWKGSIHALSPEEYDEWLTNETSGSKAILEQKMGKQIVALAYPYGAYNKQVEAKAIAAGYQYIFTVADNPVRSSTDPHSIGRYTITQGVEKDFAAYLRQGALGLANADPAPGATISNPRPVITAVLGYAGNLDPASIETSVRDFGVVRHDFDPKTSTIRLYLPRDLIQSTNLVNIRVKDAQTGQVMVANWHFNFQPTAGTAVPHAPISTTTNGGAASTNAPAIAPEPEPPYGPSTNSAPEAPASTPVVVPLHSGAVAPSTSSKVQ